ncbi:hypothetical protein J2Z32_000375 [Paenibacillus turicensis]|uniref:Uncharacterized protein n=1 Tax=Paenibacillus turicensis TaxID=160487 RepID=A0ABS4FN55_9BACL|nr:hypothetical protein [Paenibacillus turicensis]MBP1903763.1 hypothetical protein [Paenibacillus turicensis]
MIKSLLFSMLLYPSPTITFTTEETRQYDQLLAAMQENEILIDYNLPYPKYRFLHYLSLQGNYIFHGSNHLNIASFEPRQQTLYNNEITSAIFATTEPLWSMFYAVFNKEKMIGNFRNGCIIGRNKKYHFYSLSKSTFDTDPWTEGMLYVLPRGAFHRSGESSGEAVAEKLQFDEWISLAPVSPKWKLKIAPADFYFLDKVAIHPDNEALWKSWLLYKVRVRTRLRSQ